MIIGTTYLGIGFVLMTVMMYLHLKEPCSKSMAYHVWDSFLRIILWPMYVALFLALLASKLRHRQ